MNEKPTPSSNNNRLMSERHQATDGFVKSMLQVALVSLNPKIEAQPDQKRLPK